MPESLTPFLKWFPWRAMPFLVVFGTMPGRSAAQEVQTLPVNREDGSAVEVEHVFSVLPPSGYTALRVTLNNKGKSELAVAVTSTSTTPASRGEHALSSVQGSFKAAAGNSTVQEMIVPLMTDFSTRPGYQESRLTVSAGGGGAAVFRSNALVGMPFAAASQGLAGKSAALLNDAARIKVLGGSSGYGRSGDFLATYLPAHLPADWRGYLGLDILAINADEWATLQPGVRLAIRHWIVLGGLLDLYHSGAVPEAILQELKAGPRGWEMVRPAGLGGIRTFVWNGKELEVDQLQVFESSGPDSSVLGNRRAAASNAMMAGTKLEPGSRIPEAMGERSFAAWQVGVILVVFGILVGPVNLFYLAGPGRRHRLFYTTPLIALGASLLLIAVIFLQDGAGGNGKRAVLVELLPQENSASLRQYQISRTGVLFGGSFIMETPAAVSPLMLANSRWTRIKPTESSESEGQRFNLPEPAAYAGDWFQSRSEQAQLIEAIRPGRGRFELKQGGGDPVVVSSFPGKIEQFYYQDPTGQWWSSASPVTAGASVTLQKADAAAAGTWLTEQLLPFPPADRRRVLRVPQQGVFYALSHDPASGTMDSLKAIHWDKDHVLLHGRLAADL